MENIKSTNIMRLLRVIIICSIVLQFSGCKGQNEKGVSYPKSKIMSTERFDIDKYQKCIEKKQRTGNIDLSQCQDTLSDGTVIISVKNAEESFVRIIPAVPSLIENVKAYYGYGSIKEEYSRYLGVFLNAEEIRIGTSKYYDEKGYLTKSVNEDAKYDGVKIKITDLFDILKKEPLLDELTLDDKKRFKSLFELKAEVEKITNQDVYEFLKKRVILNPMDTEDRKSLGIVFNEKSKKWSVTKDMYPFGIINFEVDAETGKVENKNYEEDKRS